jgi:cytochrome P450
VDFAVPRSSIGPWGVSGVTDEAETYPFGPAEGLRLHPRFTSLREQRGLARIHMPYGGVAWLATRYEDVKAVLADPRFSRAAAAGRDVPRARPPMDSPAMLISMDPPDHTRVRRLVSTAFTARRVAGMRPGIQGIVDSLLDDMVVTGPPADLAAAVAWPLPVTVMCDLLGVPETDQDSFRRWTEMTLALGADSRPEEISGARDHLNSYLASLVGRRRERPTDDLLSALVGARDGGDSLSEEELIRLAVTLLISGHETTANQIGNAVFVLLSEGRWEQLVSEGPGSVPRAVEELLRYVPLSASVDFARIATEDVELGGQHIQAGEAVLVEFSVANRDQRAFVHPDRLDLMRENNSHLTFGHGVHHCLGAQLARVEMRMAITALITRFPALRLAVAPEEVRWRSDRLVRGVTALPVGW